MDGQDDVVTTPAAIVFICDICGMKSKDPSLFYGPTQCKPDGDVLASFPSLTWPQAVASFKESATFRTSWVNARTISKTPGDLRPWLHRRSEKIETASASVLGTYPLAPLQEFIAKLGRVPEEYGMPIVDVPLSPFDKNKTRCVVILNDRIGTTDVKSPFTLMLEIKHSIEFPYTVAIVSHESALRAEQAQEGKRHAMSIDQDFMSLALRLVNIQTPPWH